MSEPASPSDDTARTACPWCSAAVTPETISCPSCHAVLRSEEEQDLPGLTAVDEHAAARAEKRPPQRNRFLSWISGEYPDQALDPAEAQAIARPDPEVQMEIRRLRLEAEVANLQAEADAMLADAVVEGRVIDLPEGQAPPAGGEVDAPGADAAGDAAATAAGDAEPDAAGTPDDAARTPDDADAAPA